MKIDVAELKKEAKRRSKKQTTQGPFKGKTSRAESSSRTVPKVVRGRPVGGPKIGHPRQPANVHAEAGRRLPPTGEEEEEDPTTQMVQRKRKRSESGSSHSEARVAQNPSGSGAPEAPGNPTGGAGVILISPSPPRATGDTSAPGAAEVRSARENPASALGLRNHPRVVGWACTLTRRVPVKWGQRQRPR